MTKDRPRPNFAHYRTVGEAADFLGVSTATLRNWDRSGKLKPRRHPHNGYRIYLREELEEILRSTERSVQPDEPYAPRVDWAEMGESGHFIQLYESDEFLVDSVCRFVGAALRDGHASLVVATHSHRIAIQRRLAETGIDLSRAIESGRYVVLDAVDTLSKFMIGGQPDSRQFHESIGETIASLTRRSRRVHAFGEMAALLWADGNQEAAIRVEELWNELFRRHRFALFCAYALSGFSEKCDELAFESICKCHAGVVPAESYAGIADRGGRLQAISVLQQKAKSLETEIAHCREVEKAHRETGRRKDEFLTTLARELRKLSASIASALELLQIDGADAKLTVEARLMIERESRKMTHLVDDFIDLTHDRSSGPLQSGQGLSQGCPQNKVSHSRE
jgi:signal transduction histidine kinase